MTPAGMKTFRRRYKFSQQELADAVDFTRDQIRAMELARQPITLDRARKLKAFFSFVTLCAETRRL